VFAAFRVVAKLHVRPRVDRNVDNESRSGLGGALHYNASSMTFRDTFHERKSKPQPAANEPAFRCPQYYWKSCAWRAAGMGAPELLTASMGQPRASVAYVHAFAIPVLDGVVDQVSIARRVASAH
jgi:hypothetical protein